jgi:hypothetical protein
VIGGPSATSRRKRSPIEIRELVCVKARSQAVLAPGSQDALALDRSKADTLTERVNRIG